MKEKKDVRPSFSHTWVRPFTPSDAVLVEEYRFGDTEVSLYDLPSESEDLYHVLPPEYEIGREKAKVISKVKDSLAEHQVKDMALSDPGQVKEYIRNRGKHLVKRMAEAFDLDLGDDRESEIKELENLAEMLIKYTAGYGVLETLLSDPRVEDIYVDAPSERNRVYVEIEAPEGLREKCRTNIYLSSTDMESILSRFRFESGEPFSEAFPVLEADLPEYDTRITAIGSPLSSDGVALALRRRDPEPWTLPKLIKVGSLTPLAAGLLSFLIDGRSTILVAGSRGAGKTTLLGALMLEFPRSQRILTIEDTRELPSEEMQEIDYNVQSVMIGSSAYKGGLNSNEVLRVSLRLGESAIVMGEVRGEEARTLYEAMRAGTAGSSVMGTIHGNTAQSVYDRVVHDMGISKESFSATDIVMIAGIVRPGGMQKRVRKVTQISEYEDGGFSDLLNFDGELRPTEFLKRDSEKIGEIANSWGLSYSEAVENIKLRAKIREKMVKVAEKKDNEELLGPEWVAKANNKFWNLISKYGAERDYHKIEEEWMNWFEERTMYV
ncbi:MAG: type II/IV secretion system ATPase subunit [Candidatus Thermoplasmatota archaeon]|nr:type II/IV secretion system ATPase subunit [Candidatus Thermoplasmatota archaeon]